MKNNGWNEISKEVRVPENINGYAFEFIKNVYETYKRFSGDELEFLSHSELPWKQARIGYEEWQPSHVMLDEKIIETFYWGIYEKSQQV